MLLRLTAVLAALLLTLAARAQTTIELRDSALVYAGPVRLDQVADLSGPDAPRLGAITVATAQSQTTLTRAAVKAALDAANPPVPWARTTLRGGDIQLSVTTPPPAVAAPAPLTPQAAQPSPRPAAVNPGSLRALILRALAEAAGVDPASDAVSLRLDTLSQAEQNLLTQPVPPTWKNRIQVLGSTPAGRTQVRIEAFDADRLALNRTLTLDVLITRDVLVVAAPGGLTRDQVIAATDLRTDRRSLPVTESARTAAVSADALIGAVVRRKIDQGKPIYPADVAAPKAAVVIKRGEDVTVSCISGGLILKSKAKALGNARDGEPVTLQLDGSKKTFTARASGPAKAILNLDTPDQK